MALKNMLIAAGVLILVFLLGVGVGKYSTPSKSTEKDKTVTSDQQGTTTNDTTITKPDGTVVKEHIVTVVKKEFIDREVAKVVEASKPSWAISALAGYSLQDNQRVYGIDVKKRVAGPVFVGAWGTTNRTIGLSIGYEF